MSESINVTLKVWRQAGPDATGRFETYELGGVSTHASFLEMLDILNERLISEGKEPVAFDSDCREGICGSCGLMIDGQAHGRDLETATCQLHMRRFKSGDTITIEPWRAAPFPIVKDLVEAHGGHVWAHSTTDTVTLGLSRAASRCQRDGLVAAAPQRGVPVLIRATPCLESRHRELSRTGSLRRRRRVSHPGRCR